MAKVKSVSRLRDDMAVLCKYIRECARRPEFKEHHVLYHHVAEHFYLYKHGNGSFNYQAPGGLAIAPTWLSRVVEGIMRDVAEGVNDD